MAALIGQLLREPGYGNINPYLSTDLGGFDAEGYATTLYDSPPALAAVQVGTTLSAAAPRVLPAAVIGSYYDDFYNRIHVRPGQLDLGNLASSQQREVFVWNAWPDRSQVLINLALMDGEGISVESEDAVPLSFAPLQERAFAVSIDTAGPPVIDAAIVFTFTGLDGIAVRITGNRLVAWPLPCDWGQDVDESLEWLTDLHRSINGDRTAIPLRDAPRREWEFSVVAGRRERRILENVLYDWTARVWALPVWTDISWLSAPLAAGVSEILIDTAGLDFVAGGLVMLWTDVQRYELVQVDNVAADRLFLARATVRDWPRGARMYPCRTARLTDAPTLIRKNDQLMLTRARFQSDEPCDWPAIAPPVTYLGIPVLEARGDESDDPQTSYARDLVILDGDVGRVAVDDVTGLAYQAQSHAWKLAGRAARAAHRSQLYWLQGRAQVLWLPTWADDVELVEAVIAVSDSMVVVWAGIGQFLRRQTGRRHLRIELFDGTVLYRRVGATQEIDETRERLLLDTQFGIAIAPAQVRLICWMTLAHLASDRIEIGHVHDSTGVANVRTGFVAAGLEEP